MKTLIVIFFFLPFVIFGQNEPIQESFNFRNNSSYFISGDSGYFCDTQFLLGWQWGGGKPVSEAMKMNQVHQSNPINFNEICNNAHIIRGIDGIWANAGTARSSMQSMAIQWETNLKIDTSDQPPFKTNLNDANNPVFGFRYINPNITISSTDTKLLLDSNSTYTNSLILSEPWPSRSDWSVHRFQPSNGTYLDSSNGTRFYITVKLNRFFTNDSWMGNDSILKIKIKHYINATNSSVYICFDSIPNPNQNMTYPIMTYKNVNRGIARKLIKDSTTNFYITMKMLPPGNSEIYISAFFVCEKNVLPNMYEISTTNNCDSLKPEITYLGHRSINLDWVRTETFNARRLFFGGYDKSMHDSIQSDLTFLNNPPRGIKAFRYYIRDEYNPAFFAAHRYFNKLIGNIGIAQDGGVLSEQYFHFVRSPERWVSISSPTPMTAVPYHFNNNDSNKTNKYLFSLGIGPGYEGINNSDSANSGYETFLRNNETIHNLRNTNNINSYLGALFYLYGTSSFQGYLENWMYDLYVSGKYNFAYSDKIWWSQSFIGSNWRADSIPNTSIGYIWNNAFRLKTGEEIRAITNQQILMGAKGLVYDREGSAPEMYSNPGSGAFFGILDPKVVLQNFTEDSLKSIEIGGDFLISNPNSPYGYDPSGLDRGFHKDTLAKYMHVDTMRIYKGMLSTRMELKHIHDWIRANDSLLMRQKLVCWLGKGYKQWYTQDSARYGTDTIMKKFVLLDSNFLKTRPINRIKWFYPNAPLEPYIINYYEPYGDSSFFDLTILRDSSDHNVTGNTWILGVQNRRSSPLLWDTASSSVKFYATFELEQKAKYGGYTIDNVYHSASWWQNQLWSQGGAREITIPFNYKPVDTTEYCLLRIRDVGAGTSLETDSSAWWYREPFRHRIDTIVGQDRSINLRLRAGEGRLLKIDVLHPGSSRGDLSHSNQSKLIAFPILNSQGESTDSLRYHLVYFKPLRQGSDTNAVYYRRSFPIKKDSTQENIVWGPELCVSCRINDPNGGTIDSLSCDYPSIVIRKTNNYCKAFIVYSCKGGASNPEISKIVETMYQFSNDTINTQSHNIIAYNYGIDRKEWGNPVINANGGLGNFYSWSDSLRGIAIGWKLHTATSFASSDSIFIQQGTIVPSSGSYFTKHPSLNTYSYIMNDLDSSEQNSALVWQEKPNLPGFKSKIYYTRLKHDNSGINYYLPPSFVNTEDTVKTNSALNIACLSCDQSLVYKENSFPVIQRSLNKYRLIPRTFRGLPNRNDRVFWQSDNGSSPLNSILINRNINLSDSFNIPILWRVPSYVEIKYFGYNLFQPTIEQGIAIADRLYPYYNELLLNFASNSLNSSLSNQTILQLPFSFTSVVTRDSIISHDRDLQIIGKGYLPHLAKNAVPNNNETNAWKNRRVYSSDTLSPPLILSSARNFYRRDENLITISGFFGFKSNSFYYRINPPLIDGSNINLFLPYTLITDTIFGNSYDRVNTDTLKSEWFKVNNSVLLQFKCHGFDTTKVKMKIEKRNFGISALVPLPESIADSLSVLRSYTLINGQGDDYRLLFVNYDSLGYYSEEAFLDDLFSRDTMYSRSTVKFDNIIDLHGKAGINSSENISLSVFPNPADDNLYATAYLPTTAYLNNNRHNLIIKVFSSLGFELFRQEAKPGETISIPTKDYPQGAYFIRADEKTDDYTIETIPATVQGFVVIRK